MIYDMNRAPQVDMDIRPLEPGRQIMTLYFNFAERENDPHEAIAPKPKDEENQIRQ